ncbi:hypothetical protein, partial [Lysinibacillus xylanilyticus]|uniref:hypothetical protein n=1 Tax=Lysinibacillus xylanilyticus TaxID=582475 RepID=UPI0036DD7BE0
YNLVGKFLNTSAVISYWSILVALVLVSLIFLFLKSKALPIDWELLHRVEQELKEEAKKPKENKAKPEEPTKEEEPVVEEINTNDQIKMVEPEEDVFDFGDSLTSLYKTGTPKQLADVAVNGMEQKIRRMNLR